MLILTRKLGESITIGDNIKVTVLGVYGRQVRLGIEAPLKVVVHREEIYVKIQKENRKAAQADREEVNNAVEYLKGKYKDEVKKTSSKPKMRYRDDRSKRPPKI